ncbi:MAG: glycosyltransferase [Faecalimonas sp.]
MMKKKILFLINSLRDGGAEKILVDIVNHLDPNKYDIEVRLIYKRGVYFDRLNRNVKLSFISGEIGTTHAKVVSRLLPILNSEMLHRIFIRGKYDIEVAFLEGYATKIIAGAPKGVKKIAWVHCDVTKTEWINGVYRTDAQFSDCYRKIDKTICVSKTVKEAFIERFGEVTKLMVKYNPVDDKKIRELSQGKVILQPNENKITLVSIGRMTYPKKFIRLLEAVNNLLKQGYRIELWILGDGEERNKLESFVKEQEIQDAVIFTGYLKNPYPYIRQADLYVCSSIYEGFSTAATEALVLGTPVLTTDVSGMREMLGDSEYGLITENDDLAFENGLRKLLDNPELLKYYRAMAQKRSSYFEMENRLKEIEKLFNGENLNENS